MIYFYGYVRVGTRCINQIYFVSIIFCNYSYCFVQIANDFSLHEGVVTHLVVNSIAENGTELKYFNCDKQCRLLLKLLLFSANLTGFTNVFWTTKIMSGVLSIVSLDPCECSISR